MGLGLAIPAGKTPARDRADLRSPSFLPTGASPLLAVHATVANGCEEPTFKTGKAMIADMAVTLAFVDIGAGVPDCHQQKD